MTKAGTEDWKTPLGYYERAIAELKKTQEELRIELKSLVQIKSSYSNFQEQLAATQAELRITVTELENAKKEIENITLELQTTKDTNEELKKLVNEAYQTANATKLEIKSIVTKLENGSIIAQKALMLSGKDKHHWLKFYQIDNFNHHSFQIWNSNDNTWDRVSGVGTDYRKLEQLLNADNWKAADEETYKKILEIVGKEENSLKEEDIDKFLSELSAMDQLWLKYSKGRFGFSVQKYIYENLGGNENFNATIWRDFGIKVGWYVNNQWLWYRYLNFSDKAPFGHFPARVWDDWQGGGVGSFYYLMFKLLKFNF